MFLLVVNLIQVLELVKLLINLINTYTLIARKRLENRKS